MTAESYAVSLMPPPRRLRTGNARLCRSDRQSRQAPLAVQGAPEQIERRPARRAAEKPQQAPLAVQGAPEQIERRPARHMPQKPQQTQRQTVYRPYEPAQRPARRRGEPVSLGTAARLRLGTAARRRAALRARRARRRLAALLILAGLFTGVLALRGLSPGLAEASGAHAVQGAAAGGIPTSGSGAPTLILQQPALPNGCETVSLAMLLDWAGCPADPVELFGAYIPHEPFEYMGSERYGPDPETAYAGNAASARNGWYCFEGPVVEGANAYLTAYGSERQARAVTGLDREGLAEYLSLGRPLAVWVTRGYEPVRTGSFSWILPNGSRYTPYTNLHCVVLAGRQEDGQYRIADPLDGWQTVDPETFWQSFDAMGRRAVVVE